MYELFRTSPPFDESVLDSLYDKLLINSLNHFIYTNSINILLKKMTV